MSDNRDTVVIQFTEQLIDLDASSDEATTAVKNLKTYAEAQKLLESDPIPEPEPTGMKAFFAKHSGELIKVGGTLSAILVISIVESRGDVIFRSKASKYI